MACVDGVIDAVEEQSLSEARQQHSTTMEQHTKMVAALGEEQTRKEAVERSGRHVQSKAWNGHVRRGTSCRLAAGVLDIVSACVRTSTSSATVRTSTSRTSEDSTAAAAAAAADGGAAAEAAVCSGTRQMVLPADERHQHHAEGMGIAPDTSSGAQ